MYKSSHPLSGKSRALPLILVLLFCTVVSAFAAPGDTTQNRPSLSSYDTPEYATLVVDAVGNHTLTITNTHEPEVVDVTVTKIWDDDDNRDNLRPSNICVTLTATANGGAARGEVYNYTLSASDADANDNNQWSHAFEDLVKFYDGYQIAYTVAEADGTCPTITYTQTNCVLSGGKWENSACTTRASGGGNTAASPNTYTDQASCEAAGFEWYAEGPECWSDDPSDYTTQADCESTSDWSGFTWDGNQCVFLMPSTQPECEAEYFYWYNNQCNTVPLRVLSQTECEDMNLYWYNYQCHETIPSTQTECEAENLYWYNSQCNPLPGTQAECETKNYFWYNSKCYYDGSVIRDQSTCESNNFVWVDGFCYQDMDGYCKATVTEEAHWDESDNSCTVNIQ